MNPFLVFPVPGELPTVPKELYARVDDVVADAKAGVHHVRLGGVDAEWFDRSGASSVKGGGPQRLSGLEKMPVFFLEVEALPAEDDLHFTWDGKSFEVDEWLSIVLVPGDNSRIYRNLYAAGEPTFVSTVSAAPKLTARELDEVHDLEEWVKKDDEIERFLAGLTAPAIDRFAVYDVGQGGANGLSGPCNKPLIYFDFGGGSGGHTKTRPHPTPDFCLCATPLMLLSHWDADHWSSGPLVKSSLGLQWVAPYQWITSPQLVFAGTIKSAGGGLHVSRAAAGTVFAFGNARLHRAAGTAKSRNDNGFFLVVNAPSSGKPFFFPSDADYAHTVGMPSAVAGIVSTHHGGDWKSTTSPPTGVGGKLRSVFSYGIFSATKSNNYGHPTSRSISDHASAGFSRLDTPLRTGAGLSGNNTGHVFLDWAGASVPTAPCGLRTCYQNLDQS